MIKLAEGRGVAGILDAGFAMVSEENGLVRRKDENRVVRDTATRKRSRCMDGCNYKRTRLHLRTKLEARKDKLSEARDGALYLVVR
jgi:hypothetical protein